MYTIIFVVIEDNINYIHIHESSHRGSYRKLYTQFSVFYILISRIFYAFQQAQQLAKHIQNLVHTKST